MLERDFKVKVQDKFRDAGWAVVQLVAGRGVSMGFPDTLLLSPNGKAIFIEWKRARNAKKQPLQQYWMDKLTSMGHDVRLIYPENVHELLELLT